MPARCRHFGVCGGCQWQDVPYAEQLERKRRHVQVLLRATLGSRCPQVEPTAGMAVGPDGMPWAFRHKAAFVFGPTARAGGLIMGHYARGSKTIVPVDECPVHSTRANRLAFALRDHLARAGVPAAGTRPGSGILRHVVVRTTHDEREAIVLLVVTRNDKALRAPLRAFLASPDRPTGLFVSVHQRADPYLMGDDPIRIDGRDHVREDRLGLGFLVSPSAFFQTNPDGAAILLEDVMDAARAATPAGGRLVVLDLYAGSGLFAIPLAARGHDVTAIEENLQAMRDAEANRRLNRIPAARLRFIAARVEDALPRAARTAPAFVVLDPPRRGCPPAVIRGVFRDITPPHVVYVSCNPEALAAEAPSILDAGYRIGRVQPVDMFPHTEHIEAVMHLARA
jgi:23S rRNA (uracil1939-C5)-methyltransferase